jgi:tellurite methyltransferase
MGRFWSHVAQKQKRLRSMVVVLNENQSGVQSTVDYYDKMYEFKGTLWGAQASSLAKEAVATLMSSSQSVRKSNELHVLDLGCGDGRDSMFFALNGFRVTAVDIAPNGLEALKQEAERCGVSHNLRTICCDLASLQLDEDYDMVFSNYALHFIDQAARQATIKRLKAHTRPGGIHYLLGIADLNEAYLGDLVNYRYLNFSELSRSYADWQIIEAYNGMIPDSHPGVADHLHSVSIIGARKPLGSKKQDVFNTCPIGLMVIFIALATVTCTLGYEANHGGQIAKVWPAAVFQAFVSVFLGGYGVLATILSGVLTNLISFKSVYPVFALIPANFAQAFIPAWYYRRRLKKGGWNKQNLKVIPFLVMGILVPNVAGALLGASVSDSHSYQEFMAATVRWALANIPIAVLLGVPLFVMAGPSFIRSGWSIKGWWQ